MPTSLSRWMNATLAAIVTLATSVCALAADGPMAADDIADLDAYCTKGDKDARAHLVARFDQSVDAALAALEASDKAETPKERSRATKKPSRGDLPTTTGEAALASAATAWRFLALMDALPEGERADAWRALSSVPPLLVALTHTYQAPGDDLGNVVRLAARLASEDPANAAKYPELGAALCVVHDKGPPRITVNENRPRAPEPSAVWRHFVTNASKTRFGLHVAPELLVFVVDPCASVAELDWAVDTFANVPRVGSLYSKVEYDYGVLQGRPKKSNQAGWNLPNILKHGGICADQAYFAATVAKALGIPATYTVGEDLAAAHAWIGFAHTDGKRVGWDVEGRYDSYRGCEGRVVDPQTGRSLPDAVMPMLVQWGLEPAADRMRACVLRTVDERLAERVQAGAKGRDEGAADTLEALRERRETVLRSALRHTPTDVRAWQRVQKFGADRAVDEKEMRLWLDAIVELCGRSYPEMVLEVARPLIRSVSPVEKQHALWLRLAEVLAARQDLMARALLADGQMWRAAKKPIKAGQAFEEIINRCPGSGPTYEQALSVAAGMLREAKDTRRLVALYEKGFGRLEPPKDFPGIFGRTSTWYSVGETYARVLQEAGRGPEAAKLLADLNRYVSQRGN